MILPKYFSRGMSIGIRNPVVLIVVQLLNQEKKNYCGKNLSESLLKKKD
jgi:hypothetical protein